MLQKCPVVSPIETYLPCGRYLPHGEETGTAEADHLERQIDVAHLACLLVLIFSPTLVLFFALSFPNYRTSSRVVKRLSERVQRDSRANDRTFSRVVVGISDTLAAKPTIPSVLNTLLTARKDAINASIVSYNTPRIVYVCLHFSQPGEHRR